MVYMDLIQKLEKRFGFRELPETAQVQFNNARQTPDELLEDWADRVLSLATRAFRDYFFPLCRQYFPQILICNPISPYCAHPGLSLAVRPWRYLFHLPSRITPKGGSPDELLEDWADRVLSLATRAFRDLPETHMYKQAVVRLCQGATDKEAGSYA
jgi:hypothetical protein